MRGDAAGSAGSSRVTLTGNTRISSSPKVASAARGGDSARSATAFTSTSRIITSGTLPIVSSRRQNVLVDVEHVARIVLRLDLAEPLVIRAVGGADAVLALVHHEVDVSPTGRVRVDGFPVLLRPALQDLGVRRVGVDARNDL